MKIALSICFLIAIYSTVLGAELRVVSLHPLIGDLLRQVGGEKVEVIDLIGSNGDPHSFEPQAGDLADAEGAEIFFASGMGLENYLPKLEAILDGKSKIVEVGSTLPALEGSCDHAEEHDEHEHHHAHEVDPHWWHSVDLFRRAVTIVSKELAEARPENKSVYEENAAAYRKNLDALEKWVRRELIRIPRDQRKLATAHDAFQYFCVAYDFKSYSVQGLNREQMPDAVKLAELIATLKADRVVAIFPEKESNPKMLLSLTKDTGIRLGGELVADGRGMPSYEKMMKHNVETIVKGLSVK
ncbi:metal ABC transporter substrate-binding protein [Luteolibacter algae]|uniref:Metal ABC transporter substrate-binding protein n=1 Tax=Luteolibacter algae TaxID=454151 RepID=A0ABW5D959_9BACT